MALARWDAAIRKRSVVAWVVFRIVAGSMVALGLGAWLSVWFSRGTGLGIGMTVSCVLVLANELGILGRPKSGPHEGRGDTNP